MTALSRATVPAVTVAIPVYNLEMYVAAAIESVQAQDYEGSMTILVLDDGSIDGSLNVIQQYADQDNRIVVHRQENTGRAGARNRLLELTGTELIAWLDGDDLASPVWLTDQVSWLMEHDDCVAVSGLGYSMTPSCHAIGPIIHPLDGDDIDGLHLTGHAGAFFQSCVVVRKSAVEQAGSYDLRYQCAEDYSLWLRLAEVGRLANVDACHLFYRVHATSANWTVNVEQRTQGAVILNEARQRRGLPPLPSGTQDIPAPGRDDWNRRLCWINIALKSGNPYSALQMTGPALHRHPFSLVLWVLACVALCDTVLFRGNRTKVFAPGSSLNEGSLPVISCYRFGRAVNRWRRRFFSN